jgi:hypothetical protein
MFHSEYCVLNPSLELRGQLPGSEPLTAAALGSVNALAQATEDAASALLAMPFEMAREQYAKAVQWGWLPQSLLASQRYSLGVDAIERFTLGPLARRV